MVAVPTLARAAELKPGDGAPNWELKGTDGTTNKLSDFKGKLDKDGVKKVGESTSEILK